MPRPINIDKGQIYKMSYYAGSWSEVYLLRIIRKSRRRIYAVRLLGDRRKLFKYTITDFRNGTAELVQPPQSNQGI